MPNLDWNAYFRKTLRTDFLFQESVSPIQGDLFKTETQVFVNMTSMHPYKNATAMQDILGDIKPARPAFMWHNHQQHRPILLCDIISEALSHGKPEQADHSPKQWHAINCQAATEQSTPAMYWAVKMPP